MLGEFSRRPLTALLSASVEVCGVIIPAQEAGEAPFAPVKPVAQRSELPIVDPYLTHNIVHLAWERSIPVFEVGRLKHPDTLSIVASLKPDVACAACFSQRIPVSLLALPRYGFLNLHPSLLPAYRGPEPLFWIFRDGSGSSGVTIHFMDEGLDTGDIAAQAPLNPPDGISGSEAERLCATLGGRLMVDAVQALERGTLTRRPQPDGGSYYPAPTSADFVIDVSWPARRAFNYMRGTVEWNKPYCVEAGGERLKLHTALEYSSDEVLGRAVIRSGVEARIQFTPGVLRVTCVSK
jgi:methionyl-tRNA formyltransferase